MDFVKLEEVKDKSIGYCCVFINVNQFASESFFGSGNVPLSAGLKSIAVVG